MFITIRNNFPRKNQVSVKIYKYRKLRPNLMWIVTFTNTLICDFLF